MRKKVFSAVIMGWFCLLTLSLFLNLKIYREHQEELILQTARTYLKQVILTRSWNSMLGGVYAPISEHVSPNPCLKGKLRDLTTVEGVHLTKINPAMMTRQLAELAQKEGNLRIHLTSLNPIRPKNRATDWEKEALLKFEQGQMFLSEIVTSKGQKTYHYIEPLRVKPDCLSCHDCQGYNVGDIRGGVSLIFPMPGNSVNWFPWLIHILTFIIGVIGLTIFDIYFVRTKKILKDSFDSLIQKQVKLVEYEQVIQGHKHLGGFITIAQFITNITSYQNIRCEIKQIIENTFATDLVCIAEKSSAGEIHLFDEKMNDSTKINILSEEMKEQIHDVIESEFLTTYKTDGSEPLMTAIFPLKTSDRIKEVLIIGHKRTDAISNQLLEVYLGISNLAGKMIQRASLFEQLEDANINLEQKVQTRTRKLNEKNEELIKAHKEMERLATTDPLTGLYNRRSMLEKLKNEAARFKRNMTPFTIVICDIDNFKLFNDRHGHDCGDLVLTSVTETMQSSIREQDALARWGGEEFLFLFPDTNRNGGKTVAEKIREKIAGSIYEYNDLKLSVTLTFGVCGFCDSNTDINSCINSADAALYKGKESGRNCVVLAEA